MKYKIIVDKQSRTNPSADKKEYIIDIEELRFKGDVYDSLIITKDESYVLRKLKLTEFYVLEELETPIKEPLKNVSIELFEGDNYIYLEDMLGNKFYAEYLVKNEFNDIYATTAEMSSIIEMLSQSIMLEVAKKVDNKDYTSAQILLMINNDISSAKISADKIDLTATNILNLLSNNELNLSSMNLSIASDHFNVSKEGKVEIVDNSTDTKNTAYLRVLKQKGATTDVVNIIPGIIEIVGANSNQFFTVSSQNLFLADTDNNELLTIGQQYNKGFTISIEKEGASTDISAGEITTPKLTQTSLAEKKKNFEKFNSNALDIIKQIELYKYNLKGEEDTVKKHIGFVIGDKYKYSKEVTSNDNTGVDLYSFVSVCCKAIQEQQEQINKLQSKIEELEAKK